MNIKSKIMNNTMQIIKFPKAMPEKSKKLKNLFELEEDINITNRNTKIKINYNATIFFNPNDGKSNDKDSQVKNYESHDGAELKKIIDNVLNSTKSNGISDTIKVNLNINNNYYNSNYNYVVNNNQKSRVDLEVNKKLENVLYY